MDLREAIAGAWWTTNVAETQAWGSTTDPAVAEFFNCTVSMPRQVWTDPTGPRNYEVRVTRWLNILNEETGERELVENEAYLAIVTEIEKRKAA
jgi:hypothetical protein